MPELPEVDTVASQLAVRIVGRAIRGLRIHDALLRVGPVPRLVGRSIDSVERNGKQVLFAFSARNGRRPDPLWLAVHLRMTGRLLWVEEGPPVPRAHLRARFLLDGGSLLFVDTRRFGTFRWYRRVEEARPSGIDPLTRGLTARRLGELLAGSAQNVKAWLVRQDRLVGLGNIYASEILFEAGVSPRRAAGSLTSGEVRRLHASMRKILRRAIRHCGTTFSDFQDARGRTGSYQRFLAVYERAGAPCRCCAEPIRRLVQQQRSTFYCPRCQR